MTKKDFQLIAQVLRDMPDGTFADHLCRRDLAETFADALARTNPRFKRDLFIQAATGVVPVNARKAVKQEATPARVEHVGNSVYCITPED